MSKRSSIYFPTLSSNELFYTQFYSLLIMSGLNAKKGIFKKYFTDAFKRTWLYSFSPTKHFNIYLNYQKKKKKKKKKKNYVYNNFRHSSISL